MFQIFSLSGFLNNDNNNNSINNDDDNVDDDDDNDDDHTNYTVTIVFRYLS